MLLETGDSRVHDAATGKRRGDTPRGALQALGNGRYELSEFISKGGMGAVYRARDVELDRWVAVKCLLDVERAGSRELAVKEARTLASLSHPNIMRVYDILSVGDAVGDQIWIVSEWLEGRCLAQLPMPLPPSCVLAIMAQVYDALAAAHAAQVIHRDIKPSNIMIGTDGRVTLIDFGVAFAPGSAVSETIAGSLRYTDPRILEGETADAASDLFSAALLQVELMTGETVLPDLAPLPLYRHIKKNLDGRLEMLLDGAYPPLAALARRFTSRTRLDLSRDLLENTAARDATLMAQDLLRKLTLKAPEQYLANGLCEGNISDPIADRIIDAETESALQSAILTPRQKAAWIAFKAAGEGDDATEALKIAPVSRRSDGGGRTTYIIDVRRRRGTALTVCLAVFVIASLILWMKRSVPSTDDLVMTPSIGEPLGTPHAIDLGSIVEPRSSNVMPPLADPATQDKTEQPAHGTQGAVAAVSVHIVANAWATVIVDGREIGQLPQAAPFRLTPGKHTLTLTSPSVEPMTTEIVVDANEATRLRYHLQPKVVPHKIRLTQPGRLYVDGKDQGFVATTTTLSLSYGTHEILVKRDGKTSAPETIALGPDSPAELVID